LQKAAEAIQVAAVILAGKAIPAAVCMPVAVRITWAAIMGLAPYPSLAQHLRQGPYPFSIPAAVRVVLPST
jgi:hypothetical protein